jgi:type IV pilus assembly protein PilX
MGIPITSQTTTRPLDQRQAGVSLIIVMLILVIVSLLGVSGVQVAIMSERGARNDRDQQIAWQAAEAALIDAEVDMIGTTGTRNTLFDGKTQSPFITGCGSSGTSIGLCDLVQTGKPAWLTVNFTTTDASAATTEFGIFTGRTFAAGGVGIQPAKAPRYVIELVPDPVGDKADPSFLYRVTAMGFGPRDDIQAVLQMLYRK